MPDVTITMTLRQAQYLRQLLAQTRLDDCQTEQAAREIHQLYVDLRNAIRHALED